MGETLIFGPISVKFRSINSIKSLWKPCALLNNSTFYHLKSLIALPIQMIRFFLGGGGGCHPPHTPQVSPLAVVVVGELCFAFSSLPSHSEEQQQKLSLSLSENVLNMKPAIIIPTQEGKIKI
jgi:hypothetical protein